jgi:hypothetical protein
VFKTIQIIFIGLTAALLLTACGPSEQEAQKLGFTNVAEMKELQSKGFKTKSEYAKSLGFDSLQDFQEALARGKKTPEEWQEYLKNVEKTREISERKKQHKQFLDELHTLTVAHYYKVAIVPQNSMTRDQAESKAKILEDIKKFDEQYKDYTISDMECTAKFAVSYPNDRVYCSLTDQILPLEAMLILPKNMPDKGHYEKDKFLFSGVLKSINYATPGDKGRISNTTVTVNVTDIKNLSIKSN